MKIRNRKENRYPLVKEMSSIQQTGVVRHLFSSIHRRYDFLNRFFSLRRDVVWRRFTARRMCFFHTNRFLDVATGTADLAIETARRNPHIRVTGIDFVEEMLEAGRRKITRSQLADRVRLLRGDALQLPFRNEKFDVAGIAFGIRNIPQYHQALKEMIRVVTRGGQVMVLEMHFPEKQALRRFYSLYLNWILPSMARFFSQNPSAYHYLADSIIHFPSSRAFAHVMEEAGLVRIEQHRLTMGIACLHIGTKP